MDIYHFYLRKETVRDQYMIIMITKAKKERDI
jgi:hypothetical protein